MKNIMILIVLIFTGNTLFAQGEKEQVPDDYEKQIGLSATNFFLRFISFNQALENTPTILILYKKGTDGRKWRYGLGAIISLRNNEDDDSSSKARELQLSYHFGREHYRKISKKWEILYGWETHYRGNYSSSAETDVISNNERTRKNSSFSLSTGIRAIAGIQFRINNRLSLLTETSYAISFFYKKSKSFTQIENQIGNQNESFNKSYSVNTFFNAPLSIILNYHF